MQRTIALDDGDARDRLMFRLFVEAILMGAQASTEKRTLETIRTQRRLLRLVQGLAGPDPFQESIPKGDVDPADRKIVSRVLAPGRHTVTIEQADIEVVKAFVPLCPWNPARQDDVADFYDWLCALPEAVPVKEIKESN